MIDITKFCSKSNPRLWTHTPWRAAGFLYASDGHIGVRMPDDGQTRANDGDKAQAFVNILAALDPAGLAKPRRAQPAQMLRHPVLGLRVAHENLVGSRSCVVAQVSCHPSVDNYRGSRIP